MQRSTSSDRTDASGEFNPLLPPPVGDEPIELWAWVGAYDHVVLCQLWGPMTDLPPAIPRFTRELRQFWEERGFTVIASTPEEATAHLEKEQKKWARVVKERGIKTE